MEQQDLSIQCRDGFELAGRIYRPAKARAAVIMAPATGIRQRFYHNFAAHLAESGFGVITFENRGIGDSKRGSINSGNASLVTWGRQDMTGVMDALQQEFPGLSYHLVGHSAGGQLIGLMENADALHSVFNVACSSGSLRNPPSFRYRLASNFFMNFFIPVNNALFGKTNSQWVGMGEPLPKKVAAQWRKWCNGTGYVATDFGKAIQEHHYHELKFRSQWLYATDDDIANLTNVKEMIAVFPHIQSEIVELDPKALGRPEIGHMKFFSSRNKDLWQMAVDWLTAHS